MSCQYLVIGWKPNRWVAPYSVERLYRHPIKHTSDLIRVQPPVRSCAPTNTFISRVSRRIKRPNPAPGKSLTRPLREKRLLEPYYLPDLPLTK